MPDEMHKGFEGMLACRQSVALALEASRREEVKIRADLGRVEQQNQRLEAQLKMADEMLEAYNNGLNRADGTPHLLGLGRFTGVELKTALTSVFQDEPDTWFSVPTLERKILSQGFDGKITHLNASIHAACRRFVEKRYIVTQESHGEGRVFCFPRSISYVMDAVTTTDHTFSESANAELREEGNLK